MTHEDIKQVPLYKKHEQFRESFKNNKDLILELGLDYNYYYQEIFSHSTAPLSAYYTDLNAIVQHMKAFLSAYGSAANRKAKEKQYGLLAGRSLKIKMRKVNELYHDLYKNQVDLTRMLALNTEKVQKITEIFLESVRATEATLSEIEIKELPLVDVDPMHSSIHIEAQAKVVAMLYEKFFMNHLLTVSEENVKINEILKQLKNLMVENKLYNEKASLRVEELISDLEIQSMLNGDGGV